jgi:hypothetical protein
MFRRKMFFSNLLNKRAVSTVVATVLVIMITVVAVGVVVKFVIPLISDNLEEGTECVDFSEYFYFEEEFGYNCYTPIKDDDNNVAHKLYGVSVGAETGNKNLQSQINGFLISFIDGGDSKAINIEDGGETNNDDGGVRMLDKEVGTFNLPGIGEVRTYVYNTTGTVSSVEIYPILKNGRICDRSDKIDILGEICENDIP